MDGLSDFATANFIETAAVQETQLAEKGWQRGGELEMVLKVHPLGMYMVDDGPPPAGIELMLRLEEKGRQWVQTATGDIVEGSKDVRQIQRLWALRHDGFSWRLDRVWSGADDVVDLASKPQVPTVTDWARPESMDP